VPEDVLEEEFPLDTERFTLEPEELELTLVLSLLEEELTVGRPDELLLLEVPSVFTLSRTVLFDWEEETRLLVVVGRFGVDCIVSLLRVEVLGVVV
jgi:hypothetical protein